MNFAFLTILLEMRHGREQYISPLTLWVRMRSGKMCSLQHYVIKIVSGFLSILRFRVNRISGVIIVLEICL